jgi:hypothetical protein
VQGGKKTMKKPTTIKLTLEKQTIRQLTRSDYHAVVGGSSIAYTCDTTMSGARSGQPTFGCLA